MSCLLCGQSARVHAGWYQKCWCDKYCSSGPFWPLCNTFVQSANVDSMDCRIAVGFVPCSESQQRLKLSCGWCCILIPSQSLQSNRQDRWKMGSRRSTQKWSDLPEVTQQVSGGAENKKPWYFLPAWCPLPKAMYRISLRLKCSLFWRAAASSRVQLHHGTTAITSCKGVLSMALAGLEHRALQWEFVWPLQHWLFTDLALIYWGVSTSWCRTGAVCTRNVLQVITTSQYLPTVKCDEFSPSPVSRLAVFYWLAECLSCVVLIHCILFMMQGVSPLCTGSPEATWELEICLHRAIF